LAASCASAILGRTAALERPSLESANTAQSGIGAPRHVARLVEPSFPTCCNRRPMGAAMVVNSLVRLNNSATSANAPPYAG
jgi:hypothetical protein